MAVQLVHVNYQYKFIVWKPVELSELPELSPSGMFIILYFISESDKIFGMKIVYKELDLELQGILNFIFCRGKRGFDLMSSYGSILLKMHFFKFRI